MVHGGRPGAVVQLGKCILAQQSSEARVAAPVAAPVAVPVAAAAQQGITCRKQGITSAPSTAACSAAQFGMAVNHMRWALSANWFTSPMQCGTAAGLVAAAHNAWQHPPAASAAPPRPSPKEKAALPRGQARTAVAASRASGTPAGSSKPPCTAGSKPMPAPCAAASAPRCCTAFGWCPICCHWQPRAPRASKS